MVCVRSFGDVPNRWFPKRMKPVLGFPRLETFQIWLFSVSVTITMYFFLFQVWQLRMACRPSQQHHGEDVPGLFTTMSPHVLVHPLQGAPCKPRRINFKGTHPISVSNRKSANFLRQRIVDARKFPINIIIIIICGVLLMSVAVLHDASLKQ